MTTATWLEHSPLPDCQIFVCFVLVKLQEQRTQVSMVWKKCTMFSFNVKLRVWNFGGKENSKKQSKSFGEFCSISCLTLLPSRTSNWHLLTNKAENMKSCVLPEGEIWVASAWFPTRMFLVAEERY